MNAVEVDLNPTEDILGRYPAEARHLISVLQDIQLEYRYLPKVSLEKVAQTLTVPLAQVYGVATFYKGFSLTPRGETILHVCTGTACHIRGAPLLLPRRARPRVSAAASARWSRDAVPCPMRVSRPTRPLMS